MSEISPTRATGWYLNHTRTSTRSFCSFGPECIMSFKLFPLILAAESNTILTLVVALSSRTTGKWGRNHFGLLNASPPVNFLIYPFFSWLSKTSLYLSAASGWRLRDLSRLSSLCNTKLLFFSRSILSLIHGIPTSYRPLTLRLVLATFCIASFSINVNDL